MRLRGNASTNSSRSGDLCLLNPCAWQCSASDRQRRLQLLRCGTTTAHTRSPVRASGTPITATSATDGWVANTPSISSAEMFSALRMMASLMRPVTTTLPSASIRPRSPLRNQPSASNASAFNVSST